MIKQKSISKNNTSSIKTIMFISILRIFAALAVIVIHVRSMTNYETPTYKFVHACMLWCVPVFFMITGYIFIGIKKIKHYSKVKNNIIKFVVVLFTLGFFYALCQRFFETRNLTIMLFANSFFDVLKGNLFDHMWYVYSIIGIYLLLPVLSTFVQNSDKNLYILLGLIALFEIIIPDVCRLLDTTTKFSIPLGSYCFYVLSGAAVERLNFDRHKKIFNASCIVVLLSILGYAYFGFAHNKLPNSYTSIPVALMSVSVFIMFAYMFRNTKVNRILKSISDCTWGIYLLHPFFIHILTKLFNINITSYNQLIFFPLACVFIFTISYIATLILKQIPVIKKFI